jgi:signal transduction histidine kinase
LTQMNSKTKKTVTPDESLPRRHSPRDNTRNVEFLVKVSNIFAKSLDIHALLEEVIDQIFYFMKRIDRGAILLLDKDTGELREVVSKTRIANHINPTINWNRTIVHSVVKEGNPVVVSDRRHENHSGSSDKGKFDDILSAMCVPLRYKGEIQGVIYVDSITLPGGIRKDDLQLLSGLGDTAAIAIQNAQLYEALKEELDERRRAEEALTKANRDLEETRDMLVQSEKFAAIGRLSAAIAHEILNPVNIISMRIQLLETLEGISESIRKPLLVCKSQLNRIVTITESLGRSSRTSEKHRVIGDMNETIERVVDLIAPQLRVDGIRTRVELHSGLPLIPMDKERIEQVIFNLISNATAAMTGRENKVLKITTKPNPQGSVLIVFSDTGAGIDPSDIDKVFDPFFTTKDPGEGTGLGLFIAYSIVQEHAGRIWAENNESGGASFYIDLPIERTPRDNEITPKT